MPLPMRPTPPSPSHPPAPSLPPCPPSPSVPVSPCPPSLPLSPLSLSPSVYHERQRLELCAAHALNNLLQRSVFGKDSLDELCYRLSPDTLFNPHRSLLGTGNYDANVLMAALLTEGLSAVWWDKRRSLGSLSLSQIRGFILNIPSAVTLGPISLPIHRPHWIAIRPIDGSYYNLDSKLQAPAAIGNEGQLRTFLSGQLSQASCELLLVVERNVEEDGSWLSPS
ncbi:LOW QUALITY PROTEIN: josephin-2-like [Leucoraja erinacea]|uniref:LOW QUALITY PROTEIN: josephin-2-like n=1 Tax=Leucoraja erinaceus TaxID=7782 RepID=UPI0024551ED6|nr:LOW QUALITY PROTEIN: josephin-2-like [Leucoraja erinacea]